MAKHIEFHTTPAALKALAFATERKVAGDSLFPTFKADYTRYLANMAAQNAEVRRSIPDSADREEAYRRNSLTCDRMIVNAVEQLWYVKL